VRGSKLRQEWGSARGMGGERERWDLRTQSRVKFWAFRDPARLRLTSRVVKMMARFSFIERWRLWMECRFVWCWFPVS